MRPANGRYTLTTIAQPGVPSTTITITIDDAGAHIPFLLEWNPQPPPGQFEDGDIALRFVNETEFVAIYKNVNYGGTYAAAP